MGSFFFMATSSDQAGAMAGDYSATAKRPPVRDQRAFSGLPEHCAPANRAQGLNLAVMVLDTVMVVVQSWGKLALATQLFQPTKVEPGRGRATR